MRTNTDLTWYSRSIVSRNEVWTREVIHDVFWEEKKAANVIKSGLLEADSVSIYIPLSSGSHDIAIGDMLVKGIVTDEVTGGFTMADLNAAYDSVVEVHSVDVKDFGSIALRHTQLGAS